MNLIKFNLVVRSALIIVSLGMLGSIVSTMVLPKSTNALDKNSYPFNADPWDDWREYLRNYNRACPGVPEKYAQINWVSLRGDPGGRREINVPYGTRIVQLQYNAGVFLCYDRLNGGDDSVDSNELPNDFSVNASRVSLSNSWFRVGSSDVSEGSLTPGGAPRGGEIEVGRNLSSRYWFGAPGQLDFDFDAGADMTSSRTITITLGTTIANNFGGAWRCVNNGAVTSSGTWRTDCPYNSTNFTIRINVDPPPEPAATCSGSTTVFTNTNVTLTGGGGNGSYSWSGGGTPASGPGNPFETRYSSAGTYTVTVNSGSSSATCTVTVNWPPTTCLGSTTVLTNEVARLTGEGGDNSFSWSGGGTPASGPGNPFETRYSSAGTYTVTVSSGGTSATCTVTVRWPPTVCTPRPPGNAEVGTNQEFEGTGGDGNYSWSSPGGTPISGGGSLYETRYSTAGTYNISVTSNGETRNCPGTWTTKPYMRVYGGDVLAGSGFLNGESCTPTAGAGIIGWNLGPGAPNTRNYAGAGTQVANYATGSILEHISASMQTTTPQPPAGLTFANTGGGYGGNWDPANIGCATDYFSLASGADPGNFAASLNSLSDGAYRRTGDFTVGPGGSVLNNAKKITLFIDGDVAINGNITYGGSYNGTDDIPSVRIIARNIYIAPNVTQVDAVLVAQPSNNSNGRIYTCSNGGFAPPSAAELNGVCRNNQLRIHGALIADNIKFLRTRGTLKDSQVPAPVPPPSCSGITAFLDINYTGTSQPLGPGNHDINVITAGVGNDQISSIRIPAGCRAVVYKDNFSGDSMNLTSDWSVLSAGDGWNDVISSIQVFNEPTAQPVVNIDYSSASGYNPNNDPNQVPSWRTSNNGRCTWLIEPYNNYAETWGDNAICAERDMGWYWTCGGGVCARDQPRIDAILAAGGNCTRFEVPADDDTWLDNELCSTVNVGLEFSDNGPVPGKECTQIAEGADPDGDPDTWNNNYLCVNRTFPPVAPGSFVPSEGSGSTNIAEIIIYSPELWLAEPGGLPNLEGPYKSFTGMPPIL